MYSKCPNKEYIPEVLYETNKNNTFQIARLNNHNVKDKPQKVLIPKQGIIHSKGLTYYIKYPTPAYAKSNIRSEKAPFVQMTHNMERKLLSAL